VLHALTNEAKKQPGTRSAPAPEAVEQRLAGRRHPAMATLQSIYGNQALLRWTSRSRNGGTTLQRKCACGGSGMSGGQCAECKEKEKASDLQRKGVAGAHRVPGVSLIVHDVLRSAGRPLDRSTREFMEPRFGHDFSAVRVHTDEKADRSARAVNALAYTAGRDIVFGAGHYRPGTSDGQRLLAHELAHIVQQSGASTAGPSEIGATNSPAEHEAERAAAAVTSGASPHIQSSIQGSANGVIRRYAHEDCTEDDLKTHIWPSDYIARQMTKKAIRVMTASPVDPSVTPLLSKYFMTATPSAAAILKVFDKIDVEYTANDYKYECEDDCSGQKLGYVYGIWTDIHLCMNHLRSFTNDCIARTMVHEMSHYYAGTDDNAYCKSDCGFSSCPSSLSAADALENADSFACFAYELYPMAV
jgi:hypothetical protein